MKTTQQEDHKFAKELEECSDKGIEISQECKEYYKRKFELEVILKHWTTMKKKIRHDEGDDEGIVEW